MEIVIEDFDASRHAAAHVARLIHGADPHLMELAFGEERWAVPALTRLVCARHNEFSGRWLRCAVAEGRLGGVLAGRTGAEKVAAESGSGLEWARAVGLRGLPRALTYGSRLASVSTSDVADDEFYVAALSVDEGSRRRGIGSALIDGVLREYGAVVLDVNIDNVDAVRFYQRHGFRITRTMTFLHKGRVVGNHQMSNAPASM